MLFVKMKDCVLFLTHLRNQWNLHCGVLMQYVSNVYVCMYVSVFSCALGCCTGQMCVDV